MRPSRGTFLPSRAVGQGAQGATFPSSQSLPRLPRCAGCGLGRPLCPSRLELDEPRNPISCTGQSLAIALASPYLYVQPLAFRTQVTAAGFQGTVAWNLLDSMSSAVLQSIHPIHPSIHPSSPPPTCPRTKPKPLFPSRRPFLLAILSATHPTTALVHLLGNLVRLRRPHMERWAHRFSSQFGRGRVFTRCQGSPLRPSNF